MDRREKAFLEGTRTGFVKEEIAAGAIKEKILLEAIGKSYVEKLPRKKKEKALFDQTLYQIFFHPSVPLYAILDESQKIAKKYIHPSFAKFINGAFRNMTSREIPKFNDFSTQFSLPPFFVDTLIKERGKERALEVFNAFRAPSRLFARRGKEVIELSGEGTDLGNDLYIQNPTPIHLFFKLAEKVSSMPKRVLDIAAAPGGKLLLAAEMFPAAKLYGNDVSEKKLSLVRENLERLGKHATLSCSLGEDLTFSEKFDLVIADVPCSNTGVLHKRAEARWRLSPEEVQEAVEKQKRLVKKGLELLKPGGALFYMTCSILQAENEGVVEGYHPVFQETILPNKDGMDGGFGALIQT